MCVFFVKMLAVGNQTGKIFCWDLDVNHPSNAKYGALVNSVLCIIFFTYKLCYFICGLYEYMNRSRRFS